MDDMILHGVRYYLPSSVTGERRTELIRMLTRHDAIPVNFTYDATHIITTPGQSFEEVQEVNPEISIVSDLWVERSIAAGKMQQPYFYSASPEKIFSGVIACSADLRTSDEEVLSAGITLLGGQWRNELTRDVTHLFAESSLSERYRTGMDHRNGKQRLKVLVSQWFDDAVRIGIRDLSTDSYEWPDVAEPPVRNPLQLLPSKLVSKDVWSGRRILLSTNLELTGSRKQLVEDWIRQYGGVPVKYDGDGEGRGEEELVLVEECDVFVTRYRSGPAFFKAWRACKTFGTLVWLLDVQLGGVFSSPQDRVLHFPTLPGAVEDFTKHEISITAYTGEAREYLKKLIVLMGGTFTPYLSPRNTILIAARQSGTKIVKAMEWSVPIVNHTWLEDCFLHWKSLEPAHPRYTSYPVGVDFQSALGERSMGNDIKEIISKNVDPGDTTNDVNPRIDASDTTLVGQWVAPIKQRSNILDLPPEFLAIIASSLPREFLASFCLVSRHFYSILSVLLYNDVLSPPLTASQSSRLIETLRNEQVLTWKAHPATLIRKLGLTGNAYGASEVQTEAAVGVLRKLTSLARGSAVRALHWDMAAGLDELGRILGAPGQFPNLTELIVKSYATNTNFNFIQIGGLEVLGLDIDFGSGVEYIIGEKLCYKFAEAMQMLPSSSPTLHTLRLNLRYGYFEYDFPHEAYDDLIDAVNRTYLPALATLDLSVDLRDADTLFDFNPGNLPDTDFSAFLAAHPNLSALRLDVSGTKLRNENTFLPCLRSFKGSFQDSAVMCAGGRRLDKLDLTFVLSRFSGFLFKPHTQPLPIHLSLKRLRVLVFDEDGSLVKLGEQLSPSTFAQLATSFPNLTYLDVRINERMTEYCKDLMLLTKLQRLQLREYRTTKFKLTPPKRPIDKIFPSREYIDELKLCLPSLPQLEHIQICISADKIHRYPEDDEELLWSSPQMTVHYSFSVVRKSSGPPILLDKTETTYSSDRDDCDDLCCVSEHWGE